MNITLIRTEFNISEQILCPLTPEEYEIFLDAGLITKAMRSYRMEFQHRNIQVDCPIKVEGKRPIGVIFPSFKLPYHRYPCFIYLFAAALIFTGISMRKAAKTIGKKFGIPHFSHSTISRSLTHLLPKAERLSTCFEINEPSMKAKEAAPILSPALPGRPSMFLPPRWKDTKSQAAKTLFWVLFPLLQEPELGIQLVYAYFIKYHCLLL